MVSFSACLSRRSARHFQQMAFNVTSKVMILFSIDAHLRRSRCCCAIFCASDRASDIPSRCAGRWRALFPPMRGASRRYHSLRRHAAPRWAGSAASPALRPMPPRRHDNIDAQIGGITMLSPLNAKSLHGSAHLSPRSIIFILPASQAI